MEPEAHGVFRQGRVELIEELDLPDGTEVVVRPAAPTAEHGDTAMIRRGMYRGDKSMSLDDFKSLRRGWEGELDEFFGRR